MEKEYPKPEEKSEENIAHEPAPQYGTDYGMVADEQLEEEITDEELERVHKFVETIYTSDAELIEQYPLTQEEIENGLTTESLKWRRKEFEKEEVEKLLKQPPLTQEELDNMLTGDQVLEHLHKFIDKLYNSDKKTREQPPLTQEEIDNALTGEEFKRRWKEHIDKTFDK